MKSYSSRSGSSALEPLLAALLVHQFDLGRGQVDVAGQQVEAFRRLHDRRRRVHFQQDVGGRGAQLALVDAAAHGGVALRVEVDQQHALGRVRQRGGQVDRGGGLADPAFLVGNSDDAGRHGA